MGFTNAPMLQCLHLPQILAKPAHRGLFIEDIMVVVCEELDSKSDAISFALTCTAFFPLATRKLWRNVPDLRVLQEVVPEPLRKTLLYGQMPPEADRRQLRRLQHYILCIRYAGFCSPEDYLLKGGIEDTVQYELEVPIALLSALAQLCLADPVTPTARPRGSTALQGNSAVRQHRQEAPILVVTDSSAVQEKSSLGRYPLEAPVDPLMSISALQQKGTFQQCQLEAPIRASKAQWNPSSHSLLPNLTGVRLECYRRRQYDVGMWLLSASLVNLTATLEWDMTEAEACEAIRPIIAECPHLQSLDLRCWQLRSVQPLGQLPLRYLSVTYAYLQVSELDVLVSLTTLRELSILIEGEDPQIDSKGDAFPEAPTNDSHGSLEHLEKLMIRTGESLFACIAIIRRVRGTRLRGLHLDAECVNDRLLQTCIEDIPKYCPALESLYWHARLPNSELRPGHRNWGDLSPLAACRRLTSFQFTSSSKDACTAFVWSDSDLEGISQAWPELEKLRLITLINSYEYDVEPYRPRITWIGLAALAKNCQRLKLAQLEFDGSDIQLPLDEIVAAPALEMLCLAWTRVQGNEFETAARMVHRLWPNARVGWGLWYGGQIERPNDHSEEIVNRFPDLHDLSYEEALRVALAISHYLDYIRQEPDFGALTEQSQQDLYVTGDMRNGAVVGPSMSTGPRLPDTLAVNASSRQVDLELGNAVETVVQGDARTRVGGLPSSLMARIWWALKSWMTRSCQQNRAQSIA